MFVRLLVLWIYLVATSLHMVGAFATSLNGCRETPAQVRILSAEVNLRFEYDALGRRVTKINEYGKAENYKITRFLWNGNVSLHEWSYLFSERPETIDDSEGKRSYASPEPQTELTTWIFDEGTFVSSAKLIGERRYSIISDYLGTPIEAYDEEGKRVWARELDIYRRTRSEVGEAGFIPFLCQGQYLDTETGLAYNRYRYYDPSTGNYISQDPIRLEAGLSNLYAYVHDVNAWIDPWGLSSTALNKNLGGVVGDKLQAHHVIPEEVWIKNQDFFSKIGIGDQMDAATNGILLPDNAKGILKDGPQIVHCGSHPKYTAEIGDNIAAIRADYYNGRINEKAARIEIRRLQMDYKNKLWTGDVPHTIVDGQKRLH